MNRTHFVVRLRAMAVIKLILIFLKHKHIRGMLVNSKGRDSFQVLDGGSTTLTGSL